MDFLFTSTVIPDGDWYHLFYPLRWLTHWQFSNGDFPLWNPYTYLGSPLFASWQIAILYPFNFIFSAFDPILSLKWVSLINIIVAGLSMYIFSRQILKLSYSAGLISSLLFMFCGYFTVHFEHVNQINVGVWIPLLLYFYHRSILGYSLDNDFPERLFHKKVFGYALIGSIIFSIQIFGGHPQIIFYSLFILSIYALMMVIFLITIKKSKFILRLIISTLIIILIGLGLSAIQLIPSYELSKLSLRTLNTYERYSTAFSLPLKQLITLVMPHIYGITPDNYWGEGNFTEMTGYMGLFPLILVCFSIQYYKHFKTHHKIPQTIFDFYFVIFLIFLMTISIFLALGKYNPLYPLAYKIIFPLQLFRCPARMLFILNFSIALLSGYGWTILRTKIMDENQNSYKSVKKIFTSILIITLFLIVIAWYMQSNDPKIPFERIKEYLWYDSLFLVLMIASILLIIYLTLSNRIRKNLGLLILILLIPLDLFNFSRQMPFHWLVDKGLIENKNMMAMTIKSSPEPFRIFRLLDEVNYGDIRTPVIIERQNRLQPNLNILWKVSDLMGYEEGLLPTGNYFYFIAMIADQLYSPTPNAKLLGALNVKYLLADKAVLSDEFQYLGQWKNVQLFENKHFLPLVYWVPRANMVKKTSDIYPILKDPDFSPESTVIILQREKDDPSSDTSQITSQDSTVIRFKVISPTKIEAYTKTNSNGFLVFSMVRYPGWICKINNHEVSTYLANGICSAVFLEKGINQIQYYYYPKSFQIGLRISLFTLMILIIINGFILIKLKMTKTKRLL